MMKFNLQTQADVKPPVGMTTKFTSVLFACILLATQCLRAETKQADTAWQQREFAATIMAVAMIPGLEELHILDPLKQPVGKIRVRPLLYGRPFLCTSFDGSIYLGTEDGVDESGQKKYKIVATAKAPASIQQAAIILAPQNILTGQNIAEDYYSARVIDNSLRAFPLSNTLVINLLPTQMVLKIGEEKRSVASHSAVMISEISSLDKFNMADVSFFYQTTDKWNILKQSKIRYLPNIRYTAVAYFDMRVQKPTIVFVRDGGKMKLPAALAEKQQ
ncbi:hypothetical protein [Cerasicoccus maritimus]|uniref:hypothetical protein n=1 Tax=Cerasicoccus maritimus TaxID=490089 RepID=UPI002852C338|nr:hypothetical protein [Cerasicoccus maritimus]